MNANLIVQTEQSRSHAQASMGKERQRIEEDLEKFRKAEEEKKLKQLRLLKEHNEILNRQVAENRQRQAQAKRASIPDEAQARYVFEWWWWW